MAFEAHTPDCQCNACQAARPAEYKKPEATDWKADAAEAGKLHRIAERNVWHAAFLIAKNCKPSVGGRPSNTANPSAVSDRVSFRQFAELTGSMSDKTVARYYAGWQEAARKGLVPEASQLTPHRSVKALEKLTSDQWDQVKPRAEVKPRSQGTKVSGAKRKTPKATPKDRTVKPDMAPTGSNTSPRTPKPTQPEIQPTAVTGPLVPHTDEDGTVTLVPQHPIRESEDPQIPDVLREFKQMSASLTLVSGISDDMLREILTGKDEMKIQFFLNDAAKLAKRIRRIRLQVAKDKAKAAKDIQPDK